jgi:hypothetical protein
MFKEPIEVPDDEVGVLHSQGLLVKVLDEEEDDAPKEAAGVKQVAQDEDPDQAGQQGEVHQAGKGSRNGRAGVRSEGDGGPEGALLSDNQKAG